MCIRDRYYADGEEVVTSLRKNLSKDTGVIRFDERARKIIVTDTEPGVKKIAAMIAGLDQKREIVVEVRAVELHLIEEYRQGLDWEAIVANYRLLDAGAAVPAEDRPRPLCLGTISREDYDVLLEAMETVGDMQVTAAPAVTALNNRPVTVELRAGEEQFGLMTAAAGTVSFSPEYAAGDVAMTRTIQAVMQIRLDGSLFMQVKVSNTGEGVEVPLARDSLAVIGGIFMDKEVTLTKKFPILGDIPLFGLAFRRQRTGIERTEYVLFLVPQRP